MNLHRWTWPLCWAVCLIFDQVDTYSAALSGVTVTLGTYLLNIALAVLYAALLVWAICRAVIDVDRSARIAVVRALVAGQAARGGNG